MSIMPYIAVIGAGPIGLSVADSLLSRGMRVTVVDKRGGPGQGASYCNSGMIHASQATPWSVASGLAEDSLFAARYVYGLAGLSTQLIEVRMRELGLSIPKTSGSIQIFETEAAIRKAETNYQALGVPFERRDRSRWAFGRYSLYFADDRCGNAHTYCSSLARDLSAKGANFIFDAGAVTLGQSGSNAILTVQGETLKVDHIVVAAGAESRALLGVLDLNLPVRALRGYALNFERPSIELPQIPVMHYPSRSALTVFDDHVRLSGTIDEERPDVLLDVWRKIAPEIIIRLGTPLFEWSGDRPVSDLGRPIISKTPLNNLWVNTGHGHMGWTLCAGSGAIMADMIVDGMVYERFSWPLSV